jgi:hypothetical protein
MPAEGSSELMMRPAVYLFTRRSLSWWEQAVQSSRVFRNLRSMCCKKIFRSSGKSDELCDFEIAKIQFLLILVGERYEIFTLEMNEWNELTAGKCKICSISSNQKPTKRKTLLLQATISLLETKEGKMFFFQKHSSLSTSKQTNS